MRIIAIASQKGGAGKTTLAGHLAVAAERSGAGPVALMDTDPQGSLAAWWNTREADTPLFAAAEPSQLDAAFDELRGVGVRLLFIDTPPALTRAIESVVRRADLVVVPTRPSPHDLRAAGATVDLVEGNGKPLVFVMNAATQRARLTGDAAIALSQHGTVAPVIVHNRQDFAASMIDGRTVLEANPLGRSANEIVGVWDYLADRIKRLPVNGAFKTMPIQASNSNTGPRLAFGRKTAQAMPAAPQPNLEKGVWR